jgi:hypothetical protein
LPAIVKLVIADGNWIPERPGERAIILFRGYNQVMQTLDVIRELEQYDPGGENDLAFLVVDHGTGFEFITSVHPRRLENLAAALIRSGRPIGLVRLVAISNRQGKMETRPLSGNDTPTARDRLAEAKASLAQKLEAEGEIQVVRGEN